MFVSAPALFRKVWFRATAATIVFLGVLGVAVTNVEFFRKEPGADWFIPVEKRPIKAMATSFHAGTWSALTAPAISFSSSWEPVAPDPGDWSILREKDTLKVEYKGTPIPLQDFHRSPIVYADANGTATLSDGAVMTLKNAALTLHGKKYTFAIKEGKIVRLAENKIPIESPFWPSVEVFLDSSKPMSVLSVPGIYDTGEHKIGYAFAENKKNAISVTWPFTVFDDRPEKFCIFINHGEPQILTIPAKNGAFVFGKFDSFCYLGEAQCPNKLTVIIGRKSLVETIFSNTDGKSRFCFFLAGTGLSGEFFDHNRINSSYTKEIKIIMEDGREFIVRGGGNNYSLISFEIPREAGDAPIKAFVFKSYPELSRVVFNIPSLIDFFPENKGVKNWFNVRMPKGIKVKVNERNHFFFKNSIGIELDYLDHNFTKLSSYRPLVEGKEFDFSGKSYCEALIEYIQSHGNLSVENVAVNASKEFIYIKAPLWERLRDWCESPRLDRWPWTDSFSIP